jgi:hypothetical protein
MMSVPEDPARRRRRQPPSQFPDRNRRQPIDIRIDTNATTVAGRHGDIAYIAYAIGLFEEGSIANMTSSIIGNVFGFGKQTVALSFIVARPSEEPGFRLERQEAHDRTIHYTLYPYAAGKPHGQRYNGQQ